MTVERIVPDGPILAQWSTFGGAVNWQNVDEDIDSPNTGDRNFAFPGDGLRDRFTLSAPVGTETAVRIRVGAHGLRVNSSGLGVITRIFYSGGQIGGDKTLPVFPVLSWGTVWTTWWTGLHFTPAEIGTLEVEYEKDGSVNTALATLSVEVDFVDAACTTTTTAAPTTTTTTPAPTTTTTAPPGLWVPKFGLSFWVCQSNCNWDGDSYNVAGPGLVMNKTGTWVNSYRPSKIRITATTNASPWDIDLVDANSNIIASLSIPNGSSQVDEAVINWQGFDIAKLDDQTAPGVGEIENIEFSELPVCSTTTTTGPPTTTTTSITHFTTTTGPQLYIVPDSDVTTHPANWFGSGTGGWDRINSGIRDGTPDDTNGLQLLDLDVWRGTFTNPSFPGTCTEIRVRWRGKSGNPFLSTVDMTLYSNGVASDGERDVHHSTTGFLEYVEVYTLSKTAAQLANLELKLVGGAPSFDDSFSEIEIEIFVPGVTPTTTTSTTTTLPPECLEFDEFDDASIAAFWNQDKGDNPGATFTEAAGQVSFDSGPGIPKILPSLWFPGSSGGDANITWLNQEIDALQNFGHQCLRSLSFKIPLVKRPAGWGNEGDTIGIIALETDERYAAICKTIRNGQQYIMVIHSRQDLVRRVEVPHTRWPIYFKIQSVFGLDTGLGNYQLKTQYSHTGHGPWIDVAPQFDDFNAQRYRGTIGSQPSFKVGIFSHHGETWPATTTTITDPPGVGFWLDRTVDYWKPWGGGGAQWEWSEKYQAYVIDQPDQTWQPLLNSDTVFPGWNINFRPTHVKISWDTAKQSLDIKIDVQSPSFTLGQKLTPNKSPVIFPLDFSGGQDIKNVSFWDSDVASHDHYAIKKIEFWKEITTTTTTTTTATSTTGPFDGGTLCRNKWNSADHAVPAIQLQNNDYRMLHWAVDSVAGGRGFGKSSGKLYFEIKATNIGSLAYELGVATSVWPLTGTRLGHDAESWAYNAVSGRKWHNNVQSAIIGPTLIDNDIFNVAIDLDAGKVWFGINNSYLQEGKPHLGIGATYTDTDLATKTIYPAAMIFNQNEHCELYSQEGLTYQPPGGFEPWCSEDVTTTTTAAPTTTTIITTTTSS